MVVTWYLECNTRIQYGEQEHQKHTTVIVLHDGCPVNY